MFARSISAVSHSVFHTCVVCVPQKMKSWNKRWNSTFAGFKFAVIMMPAPPAHPPPEEGNLNQWIITQGPQPAWTGVWPPQRRVDEVGTFTPKLNWIVKAFQYSTYYDEVDGEPERGRTNRIMLASSGTGACRGVQWQSCAGPYDGAPTPYHGSWSEERLTGGLTISFNAAGPSAGYIRSTHVMKIFQGNSYQGRDSSGRKVRLVADGCYHLRRIEEFAGGSAVTSCHWVVLEEMPSREVLEVD